MAEPSLPVLFPSQLPVVPLRRTVVFPLTLQPLAVNRQMSVEAVNAALAGDRLIMMQLQKGDEDDPAPSDLHEFGTIGIIRQMARGPQGLNVIVEGMARARGTSVTIENNMMRAQIALAPEQVEKGVEVDAYIRRIQELVDRALSLTSGLAPEVRQLVAGIDDPMRLAYLLGTLLDLKAEEKQQLLETDPLPKKLELVHSMLTREVSVLELKGKIESQAQQEMTDAQKQYYLRQQMKAIQAELGEGEGDEIKDLRTRVAGAALPDHVRVVANRELDRLARMGPASPEYQMIRTYIDWVLELPWETTTPDRLDPLEARGILDEDHYDLDKVKERIVEYLAVRKLKGDMKGAAIADSSKRAQKPGADAEACALETRKPQIVATVRVEIPADEVSQNLAVIFTEVMGALSEQGTPTIGPPFSRIHSIDREKNRMDLEAGVPVGAPIQPQGRVTPSELPGGKLATTWHIGPYHELERSHGRLDKWIEAQSLKSRGGFWEIYWTDPSLEPDPSAWRTQILWPVE